MSLSNPSPRRMTNRGTRRLKAAYAQAQRDVKRMDPAVLAAVGRSKMNGNDLKHLAHANIDGLYGSDQERFAQQLNAQAAAQIQATTPATQRTRNPFTKLKNRMANNEDIRQGRYVLEMAYAQAKSEVKRIDPAVRQGIGRSGVGKQDLSMLSHAQLSGALRAGIEQAAQHHYASARAAAAAVAAQPAVVRQSAGQRAANAVNTASRWAKAAYNGPKEKAEKFRAEYNERRQNPTGRNASPAATPAGVSPNAAAAKAAQAKTVHAGLNSTMPSMRTAEAAARGPETGTGRHRAPESAAAFDGIAPAGSITGPVQIATGNTGPGVQSQYGVTASQPTAGSFSGRFEWDNGNSPVTPGADRAMAAASGAVSTEPGPQQATDGQQGDAAAGHNKHRKPDGQER